MLQAGKPLGCPAYAATRARFAWPVHHSVGVMADIFCECDAEGKWWVIIKMRRSRAYPFGESRWATCDEHLARDIRRNMEETGKKEVTIKRANF
jgi:hypothetical protein